ncbi:hypothetical protein BC828DRAFT_389029 [Blastocladiella britannica]|nr:hypothetical protein BC828DRAFT_389029 [Blastocladiella britannica]
MQHRPPSANQMQQPHRLPDRPSGPPPPPPPKIRRTSTEKTEPLAARLASAELIDRILDQHELQQVFEAVRAAPAALAHRARELEAWCLSKLSQPLPAPVIRATDQASHGNGGGGTLAVVHPLPPPPPPPPMSPTRAAAPPSATASAAASAAVDVPSSPHAIASLPAMPGTPAKKKKKRSRKKSTMSAASEIDLAVPVAIASAVEAAPTSAAYAPPSAPTMLATSAPPVLVAAGPAAVAPDVTKLPKQKLKKLQKPLQRQPGPGVQAPTSASTAATPVTAAMPVTTNAVPPAAAPTASAPTPPVRQIPAARQRYPPNAETLSAVHASAPNTPRTQLIVTMPPTLSASAPAIVAAPVLAAAVPPVALPLTIAVKVQVPAPTHVSAPTKAAKTTAHVPAAIAAPPKPPPVARPMPFTPDPRSSGLIDLDDPELYEDDDCDNGTSPMDITPVSPSRHPAVAALRRPERHRSLDSWTTSVAAEDNVAPDPAAATVIGLADGIDLEPGEIAGSDDEVELITGHAPRRATPPKPTHTTTINNDAVGGGNLDPIRQVQTPHSDDSMSEEVEMDVGDASSPIRPLLQPTTSSVPDTVQQLLPHDTSPALVEVSAPSPALKAPSPPQPLPVTEQALQAELAHSQRRFDKAKLALAKAKLDMDIAMRRHRNIMDRIAEFQAKDQAAALQLAAEQAEAAKLEAERQQRADLELRMRAAKEKRDRALAEARQAERVRVGELLRALSATMKRELQAASTADLHTSVGDLTSSMTGLPTAASAPLKSDLTECYWIDGAWIPANELVTPSFIARARPEWASADSFATEYRSGGKDVLAFAHEAASSHAAAAVPLDAQPKMIRSLGDVFFDLDEPIEDVLGAADHARTAPTPVAHPGAARSLPSYGFIPPKPHTETGPADLTISAHLLPPSDLAMCLHDLSGACADPSCVYLHAHDLESVPLWLPKHVARAMRAAAHPSEVASSVRRALKALVKAAGADTPSETAHVEVLLAATRGHTPAIDIPRSDPHTRAHGKLHLTPLHMQVSAQGIAKLIYGHQAAPTEKLERYWDELRDVDWFARLVETKRPDHIAIADWLEYAMLVLPSHMTLYHFLDSERISDYHPAMDVLEKALVGHPGSADLWELYTELLVFKEPNRLLAKRAFSRALKHLPTQWTLWWRWYRAQVTDVERVTVLCDFATRVLDALAEMGAHTSEVVVDVLFALCRLVMEIRGPSVAATALAAILSSPDLPTAKQEIQSLAEFSSDSMDVVSPDTFECVPAALSSALMTRTLYSTDLAALWLVVVHLVLYQSLPTLLVPPAMSPHWYRVPRKLFVASPPSNAMETDHSFAERIPEASQTLLRVVLAWAASMPQDTVADLAVLVRNWIPLAGNGAMDEVEFASCMSQLLGKCPTLSLHLAALHSVPGPLVPLATSPDARYTYVELNAYLKHALQTGSRDYTLALLRAAPSTSQFHSTAPWLTGLVAANLAMLVPLDPAASVTRQLCALLPTDPTVLPIHDDVLEWFTRGFDRLEDESARRAAVATCLQVLLPSQHETAHPYPGQLRSAIVKPMPAQSGLSQLTRFTADHFQSLGLSEQTHIANWILSNSMELGVDASILVSLARTLAASQKNAAPHQTSSNELVRRLLLASLDRSGGSLSVWDEVLSFPWNTEARAVLEQARPVSS